MSGYRLAGAARGGNASVQVISTAGGDVALYDFGARLAETAGTAGLRILVLKLDHLGDFIIAQPSLRRLRDTFPAAHIRLVVGSWNREAAAGFADDVITYDYFPQDSHGWNGRPHEPIAVFRDRTAGHYDIAIDLRVDEDTRFLLCEINARLRVGIGWPSRHDFLDIALPPQHPVRDNPDTQDVSPPFLAPARFTSRMPVQQAFFHATDFRSVRGHVIYGPYVALPPGHFTVAFDLRLTGWKLGLWRTALTVDVLRDGEIVTFRRLRGRALRSLNHAGPELSFGNDDSRARYEFRVHIGGQLRPRHTGLRFAGVRIDHAEAVAPPRFRRAELHIGEQLSLLVQLLSDRTQRLYRDIASLPTTKRVALAPFSNSNVRSWPFDHYVTLIRSLIEQLDCTITLLGSAAQSQDLARLAHDIGNHRKVEQLGGQTPWSKMPDILRSFDLVICNNSGIAHLAAAAGARTLAIYSASHQPQEWGPRGAHAHAMMAVVPCSPCGYDRLDECSYGHRCMRDLAPETVFTQAAQLLALQGETNVTVEAGTQCGF